MIGKLALPLFIVVISSCTYAQKPESNLMGFSQSRVAEEIDWENKFDAKLRPENLDSWMKVIADRPHHVGSEKDKQNAEYIEDLFNQWGYTTQIETFYVLYPTPKQRVLELTGTNPFVAKLEEPVVEGDDTTSQKNEQLPSYNAYSADGDVTAELVFVNRGVPEDYDELEKRNIDVRGKIVIAKYKGSSRSIKPKVAAEHGAIGCLIYSDPADDGYAIGDIYPDGPMRPAGGVERGSVLDGSSAAGDPLTPGVGATKWVERLDRKKAKTIMKIPVLPISYEDALPLLKALKGPVCPSSWRGSLPISYHLGPSLDKVHLKLLFNWDIKPIYDVIAKLEGKDFPDEWIIRGNHHDAWVNGADDPVSALVSELEAARSLGELVKEGYQLRRTVIFCAWDGEEPGLFGSTEWVEQHQKELSRKAVVYINSDNNGRGFIQAGGSHSLETFFNEVIRDVPDPQTGVSIGERRYAKAMIDADAGTRKKLTANKTFRLGALGSGSDYTPFLQHLGIASLNVSFKGEDNTGVYHSIYDDYKHFTKFIDPGFHYGIALSKTSGRLIMRLANSDVLPFDFKAFQKTVAEYADEMKSLLENMRTSTELETSMINQKLYELAYDPMQDMKPPMIKKPVPKLVFTDLDEALKKLKTNTEVFSKRYESALSLDPEKQRNLNEILFRAERNLLLATGLPRREWFKHQIYAPGFYTGYGVKTLPAIRESMEERSWKEAQTGIHSISEVLNAYNSSVEEAIKQLPAK